MAKKSQETALEHWGSEELLGMAPMAQKPQGEDAASSQEAANEVPSIEVGSVGGTREEAPEEAFNELKEPVSEVSGETMAGEMLADKVDEPRVSGDKRPKSKWPWILVLVLVLAVAGAAMWYFWDHRGSEDDEKIEPGTGMDAEVEAGVGSGKDESIAPEIEELSVDDELVQRLFNEFSPVTSPWDGKTGFYVQALSGSLSRSMVMNIAFSNVLTASDYTSNGCRGNYEFETNNGYHWTATSCYSGEEIRKEIAKLFGFDYTFTENDILTRSCPFSYDIMNDEFFQTTSGCGGIIPAGVIRENYKAERAAERIYLYEMAAYGSQASDGCDTELCRLSDTGWNIGIDGLTVEGIDQMGGLLGYPKADEIFDKFKWTFVWNGENYVFESLERVE